VPPRTRAPRPPPPSYPAERWGKLSLPGITGGTRLTHPKRAPPDMEAGEEPTTPPLRSLTAVFSRGGARLKPGAFRAGRVISRPHGGGTCDAPRGNNPPTAREPCCGLFPSRWSANLADIFTALFHCSQAGGVGSRRPCRGTAPKPGVTASPALGQTALMTHRWTRIGPTAVPTIPFQTTKIRSHPPNSFARATSSPPPRFPEIGKAGGGSFTRLYKPIINRTGAGDSGQPSTAPPAARPHKEPVLPARSLLPPLCTPRPYPGPMLDSGNGL